jgi:uncharacterized protein YcbX
MQHEAGPDDVTVSGLFSYPIKGCRAVELARAEVLSTGIIHDREWMVVDTRHTPARFLTQREYPLMATIIARAADDGGLVLVTGDGDALSVSPPSPAALLKVRVWSHDTVALDAGDDAAHWFADRLGAARAHTRLVRFHPEMRRDCNRLYAGETGAHTLFADGYPLLIANAASLRDLKERMRRAGDAALPMNRFRPNIIVEGLPAWDEDHVDVLAIGPVRLRLVKPCVRCEVTTTDQVHGTRQSEEPLVTLSRFRNNPDLGGVTFGWNAVVLTGGSIAPGDAAHAEYRF